MSIFCWYKLFFRNIFQNLLSIFPEFLNRLYIGSFIWRVSTFDGWSKRNHFHFWIIGTNDSTFQSCVASNDLWLFSEIIFIKFSHYFDDFCFRFWFPARIRTSEFGFQSITFESRFQLIRHFPFCRFYGRTRQV